MSPITPRRWSGAGQSGFTLVEALVALLVLAVGLLGFVGLQVRGLSYNHDAYVRSLATVLAYDMIERMRLSSANAPATVDMGQLMGAYVTPIGDDAECDPNPAGNAVALASAETICWLINIQASLPGGNATITQSQGAGTPGNTDDDQYLITINWLDRSAGADDATVSQFWEFQP